MQELEILIKIDATKGRTFMLRRSASILELRCSKFVLGGMMPFSSTMIVLIKPAMPLAASR